MPIGYEYLRVELRLSALPPKRPALLRAVTRVELAADHIAIPANVAPSSNKPLTHLLFALKHEGVDLAILLEALRHISADDVRAELLKTPSGAYARLAGYLWEHANGMQLERPPIAGSVVDLFDPARYVTGRPQRNGRWRVNFNGLGSLSYCATVERTPALQAQLGSNLLVRANRYAAGLNRLLRDRALAWAYLHETRDSFAIERESPSDDRSRAFVALLHQAHEGRPLSEAYLVDLQQATVSNPFDRAVAFRSEQNWLQGPLRGAAGVSYVPPPPAIADELMTHLMDFANVSPTEVDPLVTAAVVAFGFVYIHPFMDGNGRLSRFLYHHALCRAGALHDGLLLPVSVAMKKHEHAYLQTLQQYSRPVRDRWQVRWIDEGHYDFDYQGNGDYGIYRYWDATACVEFACRMAEQALNHELRDETRYLMRYDAVVRSIDQAVDMRGSDLSTLVISALDNQAIVSKRRRDQFQHRVPAAAFDLIEAAARAALADEPDDEADDEPDISVGA